MIIFVEPQYSYKLSDLSLHILTLFLKQTFHVIENNLRRVGGLSIHVYIIHKLTKTKQCNTKKTVLYTVATVGVSVQHYLFRPH